MGNQNDLSRPRPPVGGRRNHSRFAQYYPEVCRLRAERFTWAEIAERLSAREDGRINPSSLWRMWSNRQRGAVREEHPPVPAAAPLPHGAQDESRGVCASGPSAAEAEAAMEARASEMLEALREWILHERQPGRRRAQNTPGQAALSPAERWGVNGQSFNEGIELAAGAAKRHKDLPSDPADMEISAAANLAESLITRLSESAAAGSAQAAKRLASLSMHALVKMREASEAGPGVLSRMQEVIMKQPSFPVLMGRHKDMHNAGYVESMLKHWRIGEAASVKTAGFNLRKEGEWRPAHRWIERLAALVFSFRKTALLEFRVPLEPPSFPASLPGWAKEAAGLPEAGERLDAKQADHAFGIAWRALMWATGDRPESVPELLKTGGAGARGAEANPSHPHFRKGVRGESKNELQAAIRGKLKIEWMNRFDGSRTQK